MGYHHSEEQKSQHPYPANGIEDGIDDDLIGGYNLRKHQKRNAEEDIRLERIAGCDIYILHTAFAIHKGGEAPVGDYPLTIYLSLCGNVYFMNDYMSVYRINAQGSWSNNMKKGNYIEKKEMTVIIKILVVL